MSMDGEVGVDREPQGVGLQGIWTGSKIGCGDGHATANHQAMLFERADLRCMWHLRVQVKHPSINKESRFLKGLKYEGIITTETASLWKGTF